MQICRICSCFQNSTYVKTLLSPFLPSFLPFFTKKCPYSYINSSIINAFICPWLATGGLAFARIRTCSYVRMQCTHTHAPRIHTHTHNFVLSPRDVTRNTRKTLFRSPSPGPLGHVIHPLNSQQAASYSYKYSIDP